MSEHADRAALAAAITRFVEQGPPSRPWPDTVGEEVLRLIERYGVRVVPWPMSPRDIARAAAETADAVEAREGRG